MRGDHPVPPVDWPVCARLVGTRGYSSSCIAAISFELPLLAPACGCWPGAPYVPRGDGNRPAHRQGDRGAGGRHRAGRRGREPERTMGLCHVRNEQQHHGDRQPREEGGDEHSGRPASARGGVRAGWPTRVRHGGGVFDARSLRQLATVPVGRRPWGLAITSDGRYVCTANGLSNDVSVIDTRSNRVVTTIKVGTRPWGLAVAASAR